MIENVKFVYSNCEVPTSGQIVLRKQSIRCIAKYFSC